MTPQSSAVPWGGFPGKCKLPGRSLIRTAWLDELNEILAREAEPKRLSFVDHADRAPLELTLLSLPRTRFYGVMNDSGIVSLTPRLHSFEFLFVIEGACLTGVAPTQLRLVAGDAALHLPGGQHCVRWEPHSKAVVLRIEAGALCSFIDVPKGGVRVLSLCGGLGRMLFGLCAQICEDAEQSIPIDEQSRQEDLLHYTVELLVERLTNPALGARDTGPLPPYLKRTLDFIFSNLGKQLNTQALVEVSGMSRRTLEQAFARHVGKGPLSFVKHARLQKIRDELLCADPWSNTVTEIAIRWGVTHLSNFSQTYAKTYGELPSQTLKQPGRRPPHHRHIGTAVMGTEPAQP